VTVLCVSDSLESVNPTLTRRSELTLGDHVRLELTFDDHFRSESTFGDRFQGSGVVPVSIPCISRVISAIYVYIYEGSYLYYIYIPVGMPSKSWAMSAAHFSGCVSFNSASRPS